jgi:flagellar basal-body rod modification protein FlgD
MPGMGRPASGAKNQFGAIRKTPERIKKAVNPNSLKVDRGAVGKELNRLAGVKQDSRFVDKDNHNKMDKDGFLKLLSHQMQNQDPFKPMDQKQFATDLAQFSQLEQMTQMNKNIAGMGDNAPMESKFFGASFIGKKVTTRGTSVEYAGDQSRVNLPYSLPEDAETVTINILDSSNVLVAQVEKKNLSKGSHNFVWDGIALDGTPAVKDTYKYAVRATDETGADFKGQTNAIGLVTGVSFNNGEVILEVDSNKKVFLRDALSFQLPDQSGSAAKTPTLKKQATSQYNNVKDQTQ